MGKPKKDRIEHIIEVDKAVGKANCQAVFFNIGNAREVAKKKGIIGDYDGEMAKRMLS